MTEIVPVWIGLVSAAFSVGSACAMASPNIQSPRCVVVDGGKLPRESGGAAAICDAIERALAERASGAAVTVEVKVLSSWRLKADLTRDGRKLPEQNFATMDRALDRGSFERFATAIAEALNKAR